MAILTANKDGSSNANPGDVVITGGGIFRKNADGSSTKLSTLKEYIGKDTTKNYSDLSTIAESYRAHQSVIGGYSGDVKRNDSDVAASKAPTAAKGETYTPQTVDENGLVSGIVGFTPVDYSTSSTGSSAGASKVLGYVVVGLVGIALLDRFMNGGGKK